MQHALLERWWFTHSSHSKHHTTRNNDIWRYLKAVSNLNSCTHVNTILLQTRFGRCRYGTRIRRKWNGAEVERGLQLFFFTSETRAIGILYVFICLKATAKVGRWYLYYSENIHVSKICTATCPWYYLYTCMVIFWAENINIFNFDTCVHTYTWHTLIRV